MNGKEGNDKLYGGAGADEFHFEAGSGHDTIFDFYGPSDSLVVATTANTKVTQSSSHVHVDLNDDRVDILIIYNATKTQIEMELGI